MARDEMTQIDTRLNQPIGRTTLLHDTFGKQICHVKLVHTMLKSLLTDVIITQISCTGLSLYCSKQLKGQ